MTPLEQKLLTQLVEAVQGIAIALQNIAQQLQAANLTNPQSPHQQQFPGFPPVTGEPRWQK